MNKNAVAVALSAVAYSVLFYEENAGINLFVFNLIVLGLFYWNKPALVREKMFVFGSVLTLYSAFFILVHGSDLAIFANIISLLILSASADSPNASVVKNLVHGSCRVAASALISAGNIFARKKWSPDSSSKNFSAFITYLVPVFIGIVFLALYRQSNPLFEKVTDFLKLDFITIDWIFFTLGGLYICLGLFSNKFPIIFDKTEVHLDTAGDTATPSSSWNENRAFILLLLLLNIMALIINVLDVRYLYLGSGLPEGITHKQFVHNGVGNLILSILLGIVTIIYFFKRTERTKLLRFLVFLWIVQNILIVGSTAMRNNLYIQEALLTYKRIGVYFWLLMSTTGLVITILKIKKRKNTWYLIKANAIVAWVILVAACSIDWDYMLSSYNLHNRSTTTSLDKKYMLSISEGNIGMLYSIRDQPGFDTDSVWHYYFGGGFDNRKLLDEKLYNFLDNNRKTDWRSFNFRRDRVWKEIQNIKNRGDLRRMYLGPVYSQLHKEPMEFLSSTEWLELSSVPDYKEVNILNKMPKLDSLSVQWLNIGDTVDLRNLKHIRYVEHTESYTLHLQVQKKVPGIVFKRIDEKVKM